MTATTNIGGKSTFVGADAEVFVDAMGNPVVASGTNRLPVALAGFNTPDYNLVEFYPDMESPTLITFKMNGVAVQAWYMQRNANGKVTAIGID